MNYYERIQNSIDFMEENLELEIKVADMAKRAFMSESSYHRFFFAITGYQAKEYLINRRISCASHELMNGEDKVIDIALKYGYQSVDAFSRIFKKITGHIPSTCADQQYQYQFDRIDIMKKYFVCSDQRMLEQYPDIKVLSNMPQMRVAYYCAYGVNPEAEAFSVMKHWVLDHKLNSKKEKYRIFGYDTPETESSTKEYGYEVCVTIADDMKTEEKQVKTKIIPGGLYAVMSIERKQNLGDEIMLGWKRFVQWMNGSRYEHGDAQCLEEHLGFDDQLEHISSVDLYMPIYEKKH